MARVGHANNANPNFLARARGVIVASYMRELGAALSWIGQPNWY